MKRSWAWLGDLGVAVGACLLLAGVMGTAGLVLSVMVVR